MPMPSPVFDHIWSGRDLELGPIDLILLKIAESPIKQSKVVSYSIMSVGHGADPGFLAVSPQAT